MAETVLNISSGQILDQDVQLPGTSVIQAVKVDAPVGSCWVNFPDIGRSVSPGTMGVVIPYRINTRRVHVTTTPPSGQQNPVATLPATLTFSDEALPDASGVNPAPITNNYASQAFTIPLPPPTTNFDTPLNFTANTILVDNPGDQWVAINPGTGVFPQIAPWTIGYVLALPKGITFANVSNASPPLPNGTAGAAATVTFTEQILPSSPGVNVAQALSASNGQSLVVANALGGPAAASPTFAFSFTIPTGSWKLAGLTIGLSAFGLTAATPPVFGYLYTVTLGGSLVFATNRSLYDNSALPLEPPPGIEYNFPQPINVAGGTTIQGTISALGGTFNINGCTVTVVFYLIPSLI